MKNASENIMTNIIYCGQCGIINPATNKFCGQWGAKWVKVGDISIGYEYQAFASF